MKFIYNRTKIFLFSLPCFAWERRQKTLCVLPRLIFLFLLLFLPVFLFGGCGLLDSKEIIISGKTMGTTYNIKIIGGYFNNQKILKKQIDKRLIEINESMSFYIKDSEISRFNNLFKKDEKFKISDDFKKVMIEAYKIYKLTDGYWDCTVKPLIDLWGFGEKFKDSDIPSYLSIKNALLNTGLDKIRFIDNEYLVKEDSYVKIDLSSIAKGYAVDKISDIIKENGFDNFIVEIGGEIFASGFKSGFKKNKEKWEIGIENPDKDNIGKIKKIVRLSGAGLAASGNYRKFFTKDEKTFSHIINPKTGYPIENNVVSASVIAKNCMFADGIATALMVLGAKDGIKIIDNLDNTECYIITKENNSFKEYLSKNFPKY
jgi:FAD:protein FMN transferase